MIHACKYRFIQDLGGNLGDIMTQSILRQEIPLPDVVIPIPLHPRRLRWRGFNQSEIIAKRVAETITPGFSIPLRTDILLRERFTHPQMKIKNFEARKKNIRKAFTVNQQALLEVSGKRIWLIDDIATTGSTLFSAAETLKKAGAKEVFGIVIARQEIKTCLPTDMARNIF
jgi:ComF family protein